MSLHPYSGAGNPPKFGDYEAQRHWMQITLNLPVTEWYRNSTTNDLSYWGLDYPSLTAYQSYVDGLFLRFFNPESVSPFTSHGYESYIGKLLMRHQRSFAYLAAHSCSVPFMLILILCESLLVATFSCTTSILIKWKQFFTIQSLKLASFTATVLTFLPSVVQQVLAPSRKGFLYGLMNSSCSFYLFSFQAHEKFILLPLLPASLLALEEPRPFLWLTHHALFSMFPLLCHSKMILPYIVLYVLFTLLYLTPGGRSRMKHFKHSSSIASIMMGCLYLCSFILHIVYLTAQVSLPL